MPLFDEEPVKKKPRLHQIGEDLASLSIEELGERLALLQAEIVRIEAAMADKRRSRDTASGFFKR